MRDFQGSSANFSFVQIGEVVTTIPTIGFNVESVTYRNLNLNVWVCGSVAAHERACVSNGSCPRISVVKRQFAPTGDVTTPTLPPSFSSSTLQILSDLELRRMSLQQC